MELNGELKLNKDGIMDIRRHQRDVAAMDANYTKEELAGAQRGIAHFELDVATGSKVLLLNAIVQRMGRPMPPEWMMGPPTF
ncbi:lysis system i-spanin subunit Rz [Cronobacter dublinensis]|uniref:lysis system i-spanin subunit Rz n=1 Tax=Cronobacter dublinensis TaxID=413497 RepID=UPI0024AF4AEA|nr:lysis system i-spanin subunit Rz [Cronobacter dublinensis]MDI7491384.1 lysis system i-spanin subunit Rz [Cronobacter dublinensis]